MDVLKRMLLALAPVVIVTNVGCVMPAQPVETVWQKLGVPQGLIRARDALVNRRGNFPGLERKPPLLRIADPANLESPFEMIKVAAEVKQKEDLAPQKIKALKYLGEIGCGCYNDDGSIEAALLEGLADCTAEVRIAAAEAIQTSIGECQCVDSCAQTCCTEKIQEKLAELAYGEEDGCWIEPNAEVRAAALAALSACPPIEEPVVNGNGNGDVDVDRDVPMTDSDQAGAVPGGAASVILSEEGYYAPRGTTNRSLSDQGSNGTPTPRTQQRAPAPAANQSLVPSVHVLPEFDQADNYGSGNDAMIPAMIESIDAATGRIMIAFFDSYDIPIGTQMLLVNNGREIDVDVTESNTGRVTAALVSPYAQFDAGLEVGQMVKVGILAD